MQGANSQILALIVFPFELGDKWQQQCVRCVAYGVEMSPDGHCSAKLMGGRSGGGGRGCSETVSLGKPHWSQDLRVLRRTWDRWVRQRQTWPGTPCQCTWQAWGKQGQIFREEAWAVSLQMSSLQGLGLDWIGHTTSRFGTHILIRTIQCPGHFGSAHKGHMTLAKGLWGQSPKQI